MSQIPVEISQLPQAATVTPTDLLLCVQNGVVRIATVSLFVLGATGVGATRVAYSDGANLIGSANLTFDGTTLTAHTLTVSTGSLTVSGGLISALGGFPFLFTANGGVQFSIGNIASSVNYLRADGAPTGGTVALYPTSSTGDPDVTVLISSRGARPIDFYTSTGVNKQFSITHTASAVNYLQVRGGGTGSGVSLFATGSDTNINAWYSVKGAGGHVFFTNGDAVTTQFVINHTASAVNYLQVTGAATASGVQITFQGSDTNISGHYVSKGSGTHQFSTNGSTGNLQFAVTHTASAVNYVEVTGGAGSMVFISAKGASSDIAMSYNTKGVSAHNFNTGGGTALQAVIAHSTSAVNYLLLTGSATGSYPLFRAEGTDTNIGLDHISKGSGPLRFFTNSGSPFTPQFQITHTASVVNYLQVTGAVLSGGPQVTVAGSDTNIPLNIITKGTGTIFFASDLNSGNINFRILHASASAVNSYQVQGSPTGQYPLLAVVGVDADVGAMISSKGTAAVSFWTNNGAQRQMQVTHTGSAVNYVQITGGASGANPKIFTSAENLLLGSGSALATSATAGYVLFPSCAGTPTGVPTGQGAGNIPMIFDTTGVKLWFYTGGSWKGVVVA